jgi:hypothetical protein
MTKSLDGSSHCTGLRPTSVDRPQPWRRELQQIVVRVAEVDAFAAARPAVSHALYACFAPLQDCAPLSICWSLFPFSALDSSTPCDQNVAPLRGR